MAKNLSWFQARALAMDEGKAIRRESWHRWLTYRRDVFLWQTRTPADPDDEPPVQESKHIVQNAEHTDAEFLAADWTDEDWNTPTTTTPDPGGGVIVTPPPTTGSGGGGDVGAGDTGDDTGTGTGGGGGWGGPGNPPGPGGAGDDSQGPGGGGVGGGGGGGGADGTGGNETKCPVGSHWNGTHCVPNAPDASYTPTVTLDLEDDSDGPQCYITVPPQGFANVTVAIPDPAKGTLKAVPVSVSCFGQTRIGTIGPGASQTFRFSGPIAPGHEVRATATASDGQGHTWTGSDADSWEPYCLMFTGTWTGHKDKTHSCPGTSGTPDTGYHEVSDYTCKGQYAFNPTPGPGKTGQNTGLDLNVGDNGTTDSTPLPDGPTTHSTFHVSAPLTITGTVAPDGTVSAVVPNKLGVWPSGTTVDTDGDGCTNTTTGSETGPA